MVGAASPGLGLPLAGVELPGNPRPAVADPGAPYKSVYFAAVPRAFRTGYFRAALRSFRRVAS